METKTITVALLALIAGCTIGFVGANSLNRREIESLRNAGLSQANTTSQPSTGTKLTEAEIREGIKKADDNPADLVYQRNMGLALYRYASANKDADLLSESVRLLERVKNAEPANTDISVALGNAHFDIGYFKSDNTSFERAREYYSTVLKSKPSDAAVRTDLGLTFYLQNPPDDDRALAEFATALKSDPKNERALESAVQAYARKGDIAGARRSLDGLREANPKNASLEGLTSLVNSKSPQ